MTEAWPFSGFSRAMSKLQLWVLREAMATLLRLDLCTFESDLECWDEPLFAEPVSDELEILRDRLSLESKLWLRSWAVVMLMLAYSHCTNPGTWTQLNWMKNPSCRNPKNCNSSISLLCLKLMEPVYKIWRKFWAVWSFTSGTRIEISPESDKFWKVSKIVNNPVKKIEKLFPKLFILFSK